jgi:CTP synthase
VDDDLCEKIALFCDVERRAVIPMVTAESLYEIPLMLENSGIGEFMLERLDLNARMTPDWTDWHRLVDIERREKPCLMVALVGKYVELHDAYMSVREALRHAGLACNIDVEVIWVHSSDLEKTSSLELIESADGILVPGGFGERGTEGKIKAIQYAREQQVPYLGLCLGMQLMVVEFARHVLGYEDANSTEFDPSTDDPVIDLMPDQRDLADMGGTMRLGLYPCKLQEGTLAARAYGLSEVQERHRHRFEFVNAYRQPMLEAGMNFSGLSPDDRLVEIAEIADHPFMLGTQFHPEFLSRPNRPHPLFKAFVEAVKNRALGES